MGIVVTTESFIERSLKIHKNKYDYRKTEYTGSYSKVLIICPTHGEFEQVAYQHLKGQGCKKCPKSNSVNTEKFIEKAKSIHGDRYDYSRTVYKNNRTKVIIICPIHGEFTQTPDSHINSKTNCPKCSYIKIGEKNSDTQEVFIEKAVRVHNNRYGYSKVNYISSNKKVCIICPIHGEFFQRPASHILGSGCSKCGDIVTANKKRDDLDGFILKARRVHGDKYDYSKSIYNSSDMKLIITCPIHGDFEQSPNAHTQGSGCSKCAVDNYGWTRSSWITQAKLSTRFDSFKLYKLKCYNASEVFYKIGITFVTINQRFQKKTFPYDYEAIDIIESDDGEYIWDLEKQLHRIHKDCQYEPNIYFKGSTECFSELR